jgi:hypothetical protein
MSQERVCGLAIMSINHDVGKHMSYGDIIDDFSQSAEEEYFDGKILIQTLKCLHSS